MNENLSIPDTYWSLPLDEVFSDLKCSPDGLSNYEAQKRFDDIGPNTLVEKRQDSLPNLLLNQFKSPIILILLFATIISGVLKDWTDAVIILLIVLSSATLSLIQEYNANSAANSLKYVFMATSANFGNMFSVAIASLFLPFLIMLPKQILLINFLTDLPEMTIAGDNVDRLYVDRPHRWDVGFIRRFMLTFGPLNSVFDLLSFGILLLIFRAGQMEFHTGRFVESVLSATLVVFAVRTRLPFTHSQPSRAMLAVTGMVALVTILLPYAPLAGVMGFQALPIKTLIAMFLIWWSISWLPSSPNAGSSSVLCLDQSISRGA
jgi:magnesium-transporting ATPase (P-type)